MSTLTSDKAGRGAAQGQIWQKSWDRIWALRWSHFFLTLPLS
jgi:hypothetical protein